MKLKLGELYISLIADILASGSYDYCIQVSLRLIHTGHLHLAYMELPNKAFHDNHPENFPRCCKVGYKQIQTHDGKGSFRKSQKPGTFVHLPNTFCFSFKGLTEEEICLLDPCMANMEPLP